MGNSPSRRRFALVCFGGALLVGALFWVIDASLDYIFFHRNLRYLLLEGPQNMWESLFTRMTLDDLIDRAVFAVVSLVMGGLTYIFLIRREKARQALAENEERLSMAVEMAHMGHWEGDLATDTFTFNDQFYSLHGTTGAEQGGYAMSARAYADTFVHPDDAHMVARAIDKLKAGEYDDHPAQIEHRIVRRDGEVRHVLVRFIIIKEPNGQRLKAIGVNQDITERKRSEEALKESEQRYRILFENSPISLWEQDFSEVKRRLDALRAQGVGDLFAYYRKNAKELAELASSVRILDVNQATLDMHEAKTKEDFYNGLVDVFEDEALETFLECIRPVVEGNRKAIISERCHKTLSGNRLNAQLYWTIVPGHEETWARVLAAVADITPIKKAEKALVRAMNEAESANKAKSEFLANMSHEIRTPLNGIMGMLQLLKNINKDGIQKEYILAAIQSSKRLTRLLSDILDLSRVEANRLTVQYAPLNLAEVVEQTCEMFEPTARQSGLDLTCHVDPTIPRWLKGDAARLHQVLANLIGNAIKFTRQGSVIVEAYPLAASGQDTFRVLFSIADTGIGISDDLLKKLFQPFSQGSEGYRRDHQGAGLGLSISRRLVELMGGSIMMESEPGKGTVVHFYITFSPDEPAAESATPHPVPGLKRRLKILLAEDEAVNRMATSSLLESQGHAVESVDNGEKAVAILESGDFDLVLMDIQMPVMDGVEATKAIRDGKAGERARNIPIAAMTAYAMAGDKERFLDAGMDDYIAKPVDMEELDALFARVLRARDRP